MSLDIRTGSRTGENDFFVEVSKTLGQQLSLQIYNFEGALLYAQNEAVNKSPVLNKTMHITGLHLDKGCYLVVVSDGIMRHFGSLVIAE
ncbi:hypothetical protein C7N43_30860 [Sphingobacteriales bacterium UPWRP_1]|nr:hypothetical protein BVG80_18745 [Sphingobacteriales bacterium TSM_CSM]PSJ73085.1 hypothetical protein C7N43_30860 [Sphingobacteriales bacterium UPWRP_1]